MKREQYRILKSINYWLQEHKIKNYGINSNLTVDVNGDVNLSFRNITELPSYIEFNEIKGSFDISENKMVTLRGCPRTVHSNFFCYNNQLSTLDHFPEYVGGKLFCHGNYKKFDQKEIIKVCDVNFINN